jgi:hypothetical protein
VAAVHCAHRTGSDPCSHCWGLFCGQFEAQVCRGVAILFTAFVRGVAPAWPYRAVLTGQEAGQWKQTARNLLSSGSVTIRANRRATGGVGRVGVARSPPRHVEAARFVVAQAALRSASRRAGLSCAVPKRASGGASARGPVPYALWGSAPMLGRSPSAARRRAVCYVWPVMAGLRGWLGGIRSVRARRTVVSAGRDGATITCRPVGPRSGWRVHKRTAASSGGP